MNILSVGRVTVPTPGTPVRVIATSTPCARVFISQSLIATGKTYLGVQGMVGATGVGVIKAFLPPGTTGQADQWQFGGPGDSFDLMELYIDAAVAGDGLHVSYAVE
jgi:hypothetical protein